MNHAAVRSVALNTLNRQRANIVFSNYVDHNKVLTPNEVSAQERIFEWDGVLRWKGQRVIGKARVGISLQDLLKPSPEAHTVTGALRDSNLLLWRLADMFESDSYLLWYDCPHRVALVVFKSGASPQDQMKAWAHALLAAHRLSDQRFAISASSEEVIGVIKEVQAELISIWMACMKQMEAAGWDTNIANIEATSGLRAHIKSASSDQI